MRVTVVAKDAQEAMRVATEKKALDSVQFTPCRAAQVTKYAPNVWSVEGYHRIVEMPEIEPESSGEPEQLTLKEIDPAWA